MQKILAYAAGALFAAGVVMSSATTFAASFDAVVEAVLMNQQDGRVAKLSADGKRQLVSCVNRVLAGLPGGRKRYVAQATNLDQMQDRFGEVVMENRAEWKQKIANKCASIALGSRGEAESGSSKR
jgi:hypothetical protein